MRKLATIKKIENLVPIDGADFIEAAEIGGWKIVVRKGEFSVNQMIVFFEVDSWLPEHIAPFLGTDGVPAKVYEEVPGYRLKTKKLRGVVSQGLILSLESCKLLNVFDEDEDLTDLLGVLKYEKPISNSGGPNAGVARGNFPSFIPKTDQERCQNMKRAIGDYYAAGLEFEESEKIDGTSVSIYWNDDAFVPDEKVTWWDRIKAVFGGKMRPLKKGRKSYGVCSRNLDLTETDSNTYWQVARASGALEALRKVSLGRNIAIQGEIAGPGIQGNQYQLTDKQLFVFDIYDIDKRVFFTSDERVDFCVANNLQHVPILDPAFKLVDENIDSLLTGADGQSIVNLPANKSIREGKVYKCKTDPSISFKAISNKWLLKYE